MKIKSIIEISVKEKDSLNTICDLMKDIEHNEIARATIHSKVLDDYNITLEDFEDILYDLDRFFQLED